MSVFAAVVVAFSPPALADCTGGYNHLGQCSVTVTDTSWHGGTGHYPRYCHLFQFKVDCQWGELWWDNTEMCYITIASPQPPKSDPAWEANSSGAVYTCVFSPLLDALAAAEGLLIPLIIYNFWAPTSPAGPDPVMLARTALAKIPIPEPTDGRYPNARMPDGRAFTVVRAHTWYFTDPGGYRPWTDSAEAFGLRVTITVTPVQLLFAPGDGGGTVSCRGPGTRWNPSYGPWASSPSGCQYTYQHARNSVTATYAIHWHPVWTSNVGAAGNFGIVTTARTSTFTVAEEQAIVTR